MKIDPKITAVPQRRPVGGTAASDDRTNASRSTPSGSHPAVRTDRVELSAHGRALASNDDVSAERLTQIRARIDAGFYDDPHVVDTVARRLFASGEV